MKGFLLIFVLLACAGCVTVANSIIPPTEPQRQEDRVTVGMTHATVAGLMSGRVVVGYDVDPLGGAPKPVEVQRLYSSEIMVVQGKIYELERYITRPPAAGSRIADTDLFPVVYKSGLVVAVGKDGLSSLMAGGADSGSEKTKAVQ